MDEAAEAVVALDRAGRCWRWLLRLRWLELERAMARTLANDPDLILADEPTANLDSSIGREVMRRL